MIAGSFLLPCATGCYTERPALTGELPVGGSVAIAVTDRGRVALEPTVGPGVSRLIGTLGSVSDSTITLRLSEVEFIAASTASWAGEAVTIARDHVASVAERRISRARTGVAIAATVAGVALLVRSISLAVGGRDGGTTLVPIPGAPQ
ncbi:MAG: hypothetical protein NVS1B4_16940 [Gemmatimonadaceae bacterium]